MAKQYWLMKSEPDAFSIDHLKTMKRTAWEGVRNYTSRNFMRDLMKKGDEVFFYHSSCPEPGIAGIMKVVAEGHPDPTQFDPKSKYFDAKALPNAPRWFCADLEYVRHAKKLVSLQEMRDDPKLGQMALFRLNRLSITPVLEPEWRHILGLKGHW